MLRAARACVYHGPVRLHAMCITGLCVIKGSGCRLVRVMSCIKQPLAGFSTKHVSGLCTECQRIDSTYYSPLSSLIFFVSERGVHRLRRRLRSRASPWHHLRVLGSIGIRQCCFDALIDRLSCGMNHICVREGVACVPAAPASWLELGSHMEESMLADGSVQSARSYSFSHSFRANMHSPGWFS